MVRAMLAHGLPRCLVLVLCMLAYMDNVVARFMDKNTCNMGCQYFCRMDLVPSQYAATIAIPSLWQEHCVGDVDACEIFCGAGNLTSALRSLGFIVANADISMGSCFDVTKAAGFLRLSFSMSRDVWCGACGSNLWNRRSKVVSIQS